MNKSIATLTLAMLASAHGLAAEAPARPVRPPNVVIILADDLGYGDISANGQGKVRTPAIDALAAQGARMTSGYAPASTCTPSRYALMTGEYPWRHTGTSILPGDAALIISPSRNALPRIFKNAGYATGAVGKWHLGLGDGKLDFNKRVSPGLNELGFDYTFNMAATGDRVPTVFLENGSVVNLDPKDPITVSYKEKVGNWPTGIDHPEMLRVHGTENHDKTIVNGIARIGYMTGGKAALWQDQSMSDTFNAKAIDFIVANKDKPFFLYYAAHEPHVPRDPNPRFVGKSGVGVRGDAILQFDDQVKRLMETLREQGLEDNTLVLLSSDNGPVGADGYDDGVLEMETRTGHRANGNLRGGKYLDYEGGVRMPFLARWPGHIPAGSVCDQMISLTDMPALAARLTGQKLGPADAPDSIDPLPTLTSCTASHDYLLFGNPPEHGPALLGANAIREGKWKLILAPTQAAMQRLPRPATPDPQGTPQLFDLENDVGESVNVAAAHPDIVKRLAKRIRDNDAAGFTRPGAQRVLTR
jgi:arylsulfatase A-like enzyme